MKSKTFPPRRKREAARIANDLALAPLVAMMRLPLMAMEAEGDGGSGPETARAVAEKTEALAEGIFAMHMSLMASSMRFWPEILSGAVPSMLNGVAAERSLNAALKPAGRRVRANFRRLSKPA